MSWDQTVTKADFEQAPTGTKVARCYQLIDLGTQHNEFYDKDKHQVIIGFELPKDLREDGKPFFISQFYTVSLGERAKLRKHLESWRGASLEDDQRTVKEILMTVIGKPAYLSIIEKEGRSRIETILRPPDDANIPEAVNEPFVFLLDEFTEEKWDKLSEGLKNLIRRSPEYKKLRGLDQISAKEPFDEEEVPF